MGDILITDDEADIRSLISDILEDEGYACRTAGTAEACMAAIADEPPGLMILDIWLKDSDMDGIDILKSVRRSHPDIPIIIISGHGNIEIAVAAIKQGAYDYIEKPFNIDQLMVVVARAMETSRLRRENSELRRKDTSSSEMIGQSVAFKTLVSKLKKVMNSNGRVMLTGPAGSGKEVAARYVHANSPRAAAPFVTVSSASIEPERMEAVLFGRESAEKGVEPGPAGAGARGRDLLRRGGGHAAGHAVEDPARAGRAGLHPARAAPRRCASTCASSPRPTATWSRRSAPGASARSCSTASTSCPSPCRSLEDRRDDIPMLADHFIAALNQSQGLPLRELIGDGDAGAAADDALARQRPPAAQRDRAGADPRRRHRADRAHGAAARPAMAAATRAR